MFVLAKKRATCLFVCSKTELYDMCWDLRDGLGDCLVAAAPYGGPIGTHSVQTRDFKLSLELCMQICSL